MKMIKNKFRLSLKLFIIVWIVLIVHVVLKLTFNYWQPYVIPTPQLQAISDYIDGNEWLKIFLNCILYIINAFLMILASVQSWKFKNEIPFITIIICYGISVIDNITPFNTIVDSVLSLFVPIGIPILINKKKWLPAIITFGLSYVFLALSLWLEGFANANNMNYVVALFLNFDYYIMLTLNYFVFNFIREKKEAKNNG